MTLLKKLMLRPRTVASPHRAFVFLFFFFLIQHDACSVLTAIQALHLDAVYRIPYTHLLLSTLICTRTSIWRKDREQLRQARALEARWRWESLLEDGLKLKCSLCSLFTYVFYAKFLFQNRPAVCLLAVCSSSF